MIRVFDGTILRLDGEPHKDNRGESITYRTVCVSALVGRHESERPPDGAEQMRRWELAKKIHRSTAEGCALSAEDITLLKKLVSDMFLPGITGPVFELLDPPNETPTE